MAHWPDPALALPVAGGTAPASSAGERRRMAGSCWCTWRSTVACQGEPPDPGEHRSPVQANQWGWRPCRPRCLRRRCRLAGIRGGCGPRGRCPPGYARCFRSWSDSAWWGRLPCRCPGAAVGLLSMQAGVRPLASAVAAALLATGVSFAGNRYWTFRHRMRTTVGRDGGRYVMLSAAGLVIQAACIQLAARLLGLPGALALGLGLSFGLRFWLCRAWVWRARWPGSSVIA
jgi:putative flippase GtrA